MLLPKRWALSGKSAPGLSLTGSARAWRECRKSPARSRRRRRFPPELARWDAWPLDAKGNLAAGTSTGGLANKLFGRIGDSPIIGAGTYADNATCAVSGTGLGEEFIRHAVAHDLSARMKYAGQTVQQAADKILRETLQPNQAGLIAVDRMGTIVMDYNTRGMACAAADSSGRWEIRWPRGLPK